MPAPWPCAWQLRAEADEAEERGAYSPAMHQKFLDAGFYRCLQPRMFGGYEFDVPTFYKTMLEVSRGHPGAGWCLTLSASHPLIVASHWSEKAQRELFGPDGFYASPHRPPPLGTATPVEGGYIVDGVWDYCSRYSVLLALRRRRARGRRQESAGRGQCLRAHKIRS